ncbi:ATP-dependent Clp protease proteolytic subunit 3, chloroplastic [Cucurbita maxima]|uniref:ATP-dependent Clp protease proteolytic subunit n=1 Tax=Cucurbita maxima TaxID=3661 RepID=A0A6J1KEX5_CUCMA|nr:ATP-dependent Clp protease proteolytic subunit 3, chloroplastic [Cucurbita maxima]
MELSFTYAASPSLHSRLMCYNHGVLASPFPVSTPFKHSHGANSSSNAFRIRKSVPVAAVKASLSSSPLRRTLSSNWDVLGNYSAASTPALPRFEELDTTNMLLRQRIIFLGSQVDDMTADFIISQLLFLDAEDPTKDIKLLINSPGGSVTAGMGIYDAMKLCKADVSTVCMGLAASMGAFLLASGSKGKRFCMPNGRVMIHQPLGTAGGRATDMSIRLREMAYHKIKLNKILSRITGKPLEQIELDTDRDNFMNPWEAKEYGLIDEVIDDGKPGLIAPIAEANPPPKTRVWDLWKIEGSRKAKKNLPSETKILQNGYQGSDEERSPQPETEEPSPK